jgi:peptidoglycan/LPS O-acetylase OafA/YrhL
LNISGTETAIAPAKPNILTTVQSTQSGVRRLAELDALRGIAALSVVLWHFFCATYTLPTVWVIYWISRGDGAVVLFFLLSGFVLSLPFLRGQAPTYPAFIIRRVCRIYVPYLAGISLSILVITFIAVSKKTELSPWFNQSCGIPFNGRIALEHVFLIGNIHSNTYNNAIWSLIQEMRVSLLFPLLFWAISRNKVITNLVLCGVLSGISELNTRFGLETNNGYQAGYFFTLHIAALFIIGIMLAQYRETLVRRYRKIPAAAKALGLLFALGLYRFSMESQIVFLRDYGSAVGGAVFVVYALGSDRISAILRKPLFTFLGNISYAMYLNHMSVIYFVLSLCYPVLSLWPLCLAIIAMTLLISFPFWRYIERPSISLGRHLVQLTGKTRKTKAEG